MKNDHHYEGRTGPNNFGRSFLCRNYAQTLHTPPIFGGSQQIQANLSAVNNYIHFVWKSYTINYIQLPQIQKEGKMMMVSSNPKKHVDLLKTVGAG